jgi:hypothetical protein
LSVHVQPTAAVERRQARLPKIIDCTAKTKKMNK